MLISFVIIGVITLIIGLSMDNDFTICLGIFVSVFSSILLAVVIGLLINTRTIDEKIAMYQEENTKIEEQMEILVQKYMEHEKETFGDMNGNNACTLINLYPELKSDTLVQQQLSVYVENNNKIKSFKEDKLNASNYRWWVYFGR